MHKVEAIIKSNEKHAKISGSKTETFIGWTFPENGWFKCNVDGACKNNGMATGCSGVILDSSGHWIVGFVRGLGMGSVLNAELWGILLGLQIAWNHGIRKIWIESDSLTSINLIKNGFPSSHLYYNLVQNIMELCSRSWQARVSHTHREGNRVADSLANEGACNGLFTSVLNFPPQYCINPLRDDTSGVSIPRFVPSDITSVFV